MSFLHHFDASRVIVHIPPQVESNVVPTVGLFYNRLLNALSNAHISVDRRLGYGPAEKSMINICYHTHVAEPHVINVKIGYLPEYFYFDDEGYSGWSKACSDMIIDQLPSDSAMGFQGSLINRYIKARITKYPQPAVGCCSIPKDYALVLTQVQNDHVLDLGRFSSAEMVTAVFQATAICRMPTLIKLHPLCTDWNFAAFVKVEAERWGASVVDAHVHDLLERATLVAVINSGAGFEALLHLRTVLTFGESDYQAATHRITDLRTCRDIITAYPTTAISSSRIVSFLDHYLRRRQLSISDPDFERKVLIMLRRKAERGLVGMVP